MAPLPPAAAVATLSDAAVGVLSRTDAQSLRAEADALRRLALHLDDLAAAVEWLEQASEAAALPIAEAGSTTTIVPCAPVAPPRDRWDTFAWPDWVPARVRREVEGFWSEEQGRGPGAWSRDASERRSYPFGATVDARAGFGDHDGDRRATGRWVHAWNNIGRLVLEDGTVRCAWFTAADTAAYRGDQ